MGNGLVDMYAKCGSLEDAWTMLNKMPSQNVVTWNVMVLGHVKCGQGQKALELFGHMQHEGVQPDTVTFVGMLNVGANVVALEESMYVHQQIIQSASECDVFVGITWSTCMQNVGAQRMLGSVQQDAILRCDYLEHHEIRTCELWSRAEGTGTISTNSARSCAIELYYLFGGAKCMYQCGCT